MVLAARRLLSLLWILVALVPGLSAAEDANAAVRQVFLDAIAVASVAPTQPTEDSPALREYVLYPYLQAARLRTELALVAPATESLAVPTLPLDDRIAAFLASQGTLPVTRPLRDDWLASLAARKAWKAFLEQYDPKRDTQPAMRCQAATARIALDRTSGVADDLKKVWLTPRVLPDACDPALDWWKARDGPGADLTEQRARLVLAAGDATQARDLIRDLPAGRAEPLLQWAALIDQPAREIAALVANTERPVLDEALKDGWMRFARSDPDAAAAAYPDLVRARKLDARAESPYALATALAMAWSRKPGAVAFFERVQPGDFDERAYEWRARATLWAGDWKRASDAIAAMPDTLRQQPRWQYWAARAKEQLGDFAAAREVYLTLIPTDNWYAVLASARLDRKFAPTLESLRTTDAAMATLADEPAFVRAHELQLCGLTTEAGTEWRAALDALSAARQVDAVGLAARWGWHDQAIATAARQRLFNDYDLLYPRPFDFEVDRASQRTELPESLIYAIIRQESLYRADASSSAGALGLMQLLPSTARSAAKRAKLPMPSRAQLLLPAVNVPLGSSYLADLVGRFGGDTAIASAAYNAGPIAAQRWLPAMPLDLDVWVENIPFNETRNYVQRVAWHALVFSWLDKRKPQEVKSWLRSVAAAAPAS